MFAALRLEIIERLNTASRYFDKTCLPGPAEYAATSKGMSFISMYATWEFSVKSTVHAAISEIAARGTSVGDVRLELMGIILFPELQSVTMAGKRRFWEKTASFLEKIGSVDVVSAHSNAFPSDGSQYRLSQLDVIWRLFGVTEPVVPKVTLRPLVAEIVENRNAIAHGRETASDIGRRYSKNDIAKKLNSTQELCLHVVSVLESHCATPANLNR